MAFLTNEKLVIVGAGGMIGSNMVQSVLMLGLTPNICLYDIYEPGVHGVFDEMQQCAFPGANLTYTVNAEEAFTGAKYIISSGGAPRKDAIDSDITFFACKVYGTSPLTMLCAKPSAIAVLPTPGSPNNIGLFLVRRDNI